MRKFTFRVLMVLALLLWLPGGMNVPMVHATGPVRWQVLGAARNLPTLYQPAGLAVDARGNVYVADAGNFRVVEIGPAGQLLAHFGDAVLRPGPGAQVPRNGGEAGPRSLAVDVRGFVYVADSINRSVHVFSPQHHLVGNWPISIPEANVRQLAVTIGRRSTIIVAIAAQITCVVPTGPQYCASYSIVQRRSLQGAVLDQFHSRIGPSGGAVNQNTISQIAVAVDPRGNTYVTTGGVRPCYKDCPQFHFLVKYGPGDMVLGRWGAAELDVSAHWPALAIGGRGNVFLADDFNHRIDKRGPGGNVLAHWSLPSLVPPLTGPSGIAMDRNGDMYVSDPGSGRILKLSPHGTVLGQWGTGGSAPGRFWFPGGVALDTSGRLWVDDAINKRVQVRESSGRFHVAFAVTHAGSAIALDRQGNVYLAQQWGQAVYLSKFSPAGKLLSRWGNLHLAELPSGIAIAPDGGIFVVGFVFFRNDPSRLGLSGEDILRLSPSGRQLGLFHVDNTVTGSGIAVDARGNSYIAYGGMTPHVEKRSRDGVLLASWGVPFPIFESSPAAIALDSTGAIYVANTPQSSVEAFAPNGGPAGAWSVHGSYPGQFHHPSGIVVAPNGTLYVADTDNHRIQRLAR